MECQNICILLFSFFINRNDFKQTNKKSVAQWEKPNNIVGWRKGLYMTWFYHPKTTDQEADGLFCTAAGSTENRRRSPQSSNERRPKGLPPKSGECPLLLKDPATFQHYSNEDMLEVTPWVRRRAPKMGRRHLAFRNRLTLCSSKIRQL